MPSADCQPLLTHLNDTLLGKQEAVTLVLAVLLAGGHLLLEDVPGVGKTLLARTLAEAVSGDWKRVQFSPDLLPSDVTGVNMFHPGTGDFRFIRGPLFTHVLLADEINRASPRTQACLLEAMEEGRVTLDGHTHPLPRPFLVIATQNPIEHQGTFPLPEAQLDRFAATIQLGYPDADEEARLLAREASRPFHGEAGRALAEPSDLLRWQGEVREVHVEASLQRYVVEFVGRTRNHPAIRLGVSPRGSLVWQRVAQALAWLTGRDFVTPDDLKRAAIPCLAHRVLLAGASTTPERQRTLAELLRTTAVPV
ncbi:MAG: MoxR family ATPase [Candidatus Sericytochromatia bacterium]|nr:MoxR family ATPase [Candidatus Sericytochromatia bacterium]